jgi:hypothetical protein
MHASQIGIDHCAIGHDGVRVAVGKDHARVHTNQPLGNLQEDVNDMLDPHNGDVALAQRSDGVH